MSSSHPDIHAFADGELTASEAEATRLHLATCTECQRELHEVMQLDSVVEQVGFRQAQPDRGGATVLPLRRSFVRRLAPFAAVAAAAALVFVVTQRTSGADPVIVLSGSRSVEARVTWAAANGWRPYDTVRGSADGASSVSMAQLAKLEASGDKQALADALLLNGDATRAKALLGALSSEKPEVLVDLAAVALASNHPQEALELAQAAVDVNPKHAAALWNKALAARDLGFTGVASRTFGEVAALGEPGWAKEAGERSTALRTQLDQRRSQFEAARAAGIKMIFEHVPMPNELITAAPSLARMYFAYALRTARPEEAAALQPVAARLNRPLSANTRHSEEMRGLFAYYFQRIGIAVPNQAPLTEAEVTALAATLVTEKEKDFGDLLFVLPMARALDAHFELYAEAVAKADDPFFTFALENERAARDPKNAEQRYQNVATQAAAVAPMRAMQALEQLANRAHAAHRATDTQSAAQRALTIAREQGDFTSETRLLSVLADGARFRDLRGLAQAASEERVERAPADCAARQYAAESGAALEIVMLEPQRARERLAQATTEQCEGPLSITVGAAVLADVMRLGAARPGDDELLARALAEASEPGDVMMAKHVQGRALIDRKPTEGEALLKEAVVLANAAIAADPADASAKKVKAYSFGLLKNAAAQKRDFERVFALSREELGGDQDAACTLLVDVEDDRVAVAARTSSGGFTGAFERVALTKHHREGLEPDEIAKVVAPIVKSLGTECAAVRVRASYPLNGRTGWLPDDLAWSYAGRQPVRTPSAGPWLWVHDVETPAGYKRLGVGPAPVEFERTLSGAAATPENVVEQMRGAALIAIDAHGVVDEGSDTAHLVLASGPTGYALDGDRIAKVSLEVHPIVVLGACRASTTAPYVHETVSLPQAFLEAGASGVIAAPMDLPDAEARSFFAAVLTRLRKGETASRAVRDERAEWLKQGGAPWVRQVLVFN